MDEIKNRMRDLAEQAYRSQRYSYSNFLSESDAADLMQMEKELDYIGFTTFGGAEATSRVVAAFGQESEFGYAPAFPIVCIEVKPLAEKFAEELNHRDYLGALMNLGIERDTIGDIIVKEKQAFLFCLETMSEYICNSLTKIKHTYVKCGVLTEIPDVIAPVLVREEAIVNSERADAVLAKLLKLSRIESFLLFQDKKVFVNGKQYENNSGVLKEHDVVSVRGYGKFLYHGNAVETRKGRIKITVEWYRSVSEKA